MSCGRRGTALPEAIRVALICLTLDHGGAERHILNLSRALRSSPIQPVVVVLARDARHDLRLQFERAGAPVVCPPYSRNDWRVLRWLASFLRTERIDVAHSFLWRPDATFALTAALTGFRNVICSERGDRVWSTYWQRAWWWRRVFDRAVTFRVARLVVSNSQAGVEALVRAGCPRAKTVVIPNGVDLADADAAGASARALRERYGLTDAFVVGFVGRLVPLKGASDFISAADQMVKRAPHAGLKFLMVGDGPLRGELQEQVRGLGLTDRFVFPGQVDSALPLMHAMNAGVVCSPEGSAESCPNVLLEFMACGRPVVGTRVAGIPELLRDGQTGRLVPCGSIDALAQACLELQQAPERVLTWGRAARERVEQGYQMSSVAGRFAQLYMSVAREA